MKFNKQVAYAISVALASAAQAALAADEEQPPPGTIAEVVVTSQRRSESIQDVPITVQAITGDQLKQLNVVSFNDLMKYTPNVTFSGNGPGTGNIFLRGLGGVGSGNGTGKGSGNGPGTGGGNAEIFPPTVVALTILPIPVPSKVRPYTLVALFDVDTLGNATLLTFNPSRDGGYNKRIREMLSEIRFRPATRADGRPVRDTAQISAVAP